MLRNKVKSFLKVSGTPKTVFCKAVEISPTHFYAWLKGARIISDDLAERINVYIDSRIKTLSSL